MMEENENGEEITIEIEVLPGEGGERLDTFLTERMEDVSRSYVKRLITDGRVTTPGKAGKAPSPSHKVKEGEVYAIVLPEPEAQDIEPEPIPLDVIYEDEDLVVLNKAPGMMVHPAPGQLKGTLVSGLLYRYNTLSGLQGETRPGIVHRLDKDTSGVMVAARNDRAHRVLADQFKEHTTVKLYLAIVHGKPKLNEGEIGRPIGRALHQVGKMAVDGLDAKEARTLYEVVDTIKEFSLMKCRILTGRTHQIRLHMAHIGCPVVCDALYGREAVITKADIGGPKGDDTVLLKRQALHAHRLTFRHPVSSIEMTFEAPMPADMAGFLDYLREIQL